MNKMELFLLLTIIAGISGASLDGHCMTTDHCGTIDAICNSGVCDCDPKTQKYNGNCLQVIDSSEKCMSDLDCIPSYGNRTICINNICHCKEYHHLQNVGYEHPQCLKNRGLYENCLTDEDCYYGYNMVDKMRCRHGECSCLPGYFERHRKCTNSTNATQISQFILVVISILNFLRLVL